VELERLQILKMLEAGRINAEEAEELLAALGSQSEAAVETPAPTYEPAVPWERRWTGCWLYVMIAGGVVLLIGVMGMGLAYTSSAASGWLLCGWVPLLVGLAVVLLALWSRRATWLHLRISEGGKHRMAFRFPLPLTLAAWVLRIAQPFIPQLQETGVDEVIFALRDSTSRGQPFTIDVQDDENGERVQIYIG
jgi:hypothetical protein